MRQITVVFITRADIWQEEEVGARQLRALLVAHVRPSDVQAQPEARLVQKYSLAVLWATARRADTMHMARLRSSGAAHLAADAMQLYARDPEVRGWASALLQELRGARP